MNNATTKLRGAAALTLIALVALGCSSESPYEDEARRIAENLDTFDDLDYRVFTQQEWADLHLSHAEDIIVHWPDGRMTVGIDAHIEDLAAMFVWAPDTRIEEHPIRIGDGEYTAVVGWIEGTFTEPMPLGDDQFIEPTGNAYRLRMVTVGHWNDDGVMDEEFLFWDNQEFYRQHGLLE